MAMILLDLAKCSWAIAGTHVGLNPTPTHIKVTLLVQRSFEAPRRCSTLVGRLRQIYGPLGRQ